MQHHMLTAPPSQTHTPLKVFGTSDWQLCGWSTQHIAGLSHFPVQDMNLLFLYLNHQDWSSQGSENIQNVENVKKKTTK